MYFADARTAIPIEVGVYVSAIGEINEMDMVNHCWCRSILKNIRTIISISEKQIEINAYKILRIQCIFVGVSHKHLSAPHVER